MINKHKSNKIKENSNTVRHLNNGTDHRHSKSCCDQSSPARRTMSCYLLTLVTSELRWPRIWCCHYLPPGSLLTVGASESLSYSHVSFNLILNVLHERYIIQTYMEEMYKHAFRVCAIWDAQAFSLMNYCGFNIEPFCSDVCGDHRRPQTLAEICRNMGICCGFRAVAAREKYPGLT